MIKYEITNVFDFLFVVVANIIIWPLCIAFILMIPYSIYDGLTGMPIFTIFKKENKKETSQSSRKITKKERRRIEKAIDDAYKRMR